MSRPSKMTPETIRLLCEAIRMGATYDIACQYAGISPSTFYSWCAKGRKADGGEYVELLEDIKRAEGKGALANLAIIQKSAKDGDWKASAWILERRHGYSKAYTVKQEEQIQSQPSLPEGTIDILQSQLTKTVRASEEALQAGSYQAFASLQRQVINTAIQIKHIKEADGVEEYAEASDVDLIEQITSIVSNLPPVLKQRLHADILNLTTNDFSVTIEED